VFAVRARLVLAAALLQYLSAAILLTAALVTIASLANLVHLHPAVLPQIAAYLALGGGMFLALLLQAFGSRTIPVAACAAALAVEIATRDLGVWGQLTTCTGLMVVLAVYAGMELGSAVRHAY
jgi:hypothetical protein